MSGSGLWATQAFVPRRTQGTATGADVLYFCVRDGRVAPRCRWQIKRSISVGSGLQETSLFYQAKFLQGTVTGERWERCLWQSKRPERVAGVGEGRRCAVTEDIHRAPQQETGGQSILFQ